MLRKVASALIALLMLGSMVAPIMAIQGSSQQGATQQSPQQNTDPNYWTKEKMQNAKPMGMWENPNQGHQGPRKIEEIKEGERVDSHEFDDGTVVDEGKRCADFQDVNSEDKLCKYLKTAKNRSVVMENARFYLNAPISRGQFAALVVRAFKLEADYSKEEGFVDVPEDNTFYEPIMILKTLDIATGAEVNGEWKFAPEWPLTRGQAIKILVNTLEVSGLFEFEDIMTGDEDEIEDEIEDGIEDEDEIEDEDNNDSNDDNDDDSDVEGAQDDTLRTVYKDENIDNDKFAGFVKKVHKSEGKMPEPIIKGYGDGYLRLGRLVSRLEAIVMITRAMWAAGLIDGLEEIPMPMPSIKPSPSTTPAGEGEHQVKELKLEVKMKEYEYMPELIKVYPGQKVLLKLKSLDTTHDFVIDDLDVSSGNVEMGKEKIIDFRIPEDAEAGTEYEFYCSRGEHKANGMVGKLVVQELE